MTRRSLLLLGAASVIRPAAGSKIAVEVEKTGLLAGKKHMLVFTDYSGEVTKPSPKTWQVHFTVRPASVRCEDTWVSEKDRVKIVKSTIHDLLEAEKYPEIRYASTSVRPSGDASYLMEGVLTIRGRSHPVRVAVKSEMDGAGKRWWNGSALIGLRDFDLKPPSAGLGTVGTKNEIRLLFRLADTEV